MLSEPVYIPYYYDDNHCLQSAVIMVLHDLGYPVSFQYVDAITEYESNLYSWAPRSAAALSRLQPDTTLYTLTDYEEFAKSGEQYFKELNVFNPLWYELQKAHASKGFLKEQQAAKEAINLGLIEQKELSLGDINSLSEDNYLIALVDAGKLYGWQISMGHFVLIYGSDEKNFFIHDPGVLRKAYWRVPKWLLKTAFMHELIAVKKQ